MFRLWQNENSFVNRLWLWWLHNQRQNNTTMVPLSIIITIVTIATSVTAAEDKVIFGDPSQSSPSASLTSSSCTTVGGPGEGSPCQFPFIYKGVSRNGCITEADPDNRWNIFSCPTKYFSLFDKIFFSWLTKYVFLPWLTKYFFLGYKKYFLTYIFCFSDCGQLLWLWSLPHIDFITLHLWLILKHEYW